MGKGGGGGSNDADRAAAEATREQTRFAKEIWNSTRGIRDTLGGQYMDYLKGGDVTATPEFRAATAVADMQARRNEDKILASMPTGGGITEMLAQNDYMRGAQQAQAAGAIADTYSNRALQYGTFGAAQGTQGMGMAGQTAAQLAAAQAQENAGKSAGLGSAAGSIGAAIIGK